MTKEQVKTGAPRKKGRTSITSTANAKTTVYLCHVYLQRSSLGSLRTDNVKNTHLKQQQPPSSILGKNQMVTTDNKNGNFITVMNREWNSD